MLKIKDGYKLELKTPKTIQNKTMQNNRQNKKWTKTTAPWSSWSSFSPMSSAI